MPGEIHFSEKQWAGLLTGIFLILAVMYGVAIPIFEASDEIWHYPYVKQLADGRGLPIAGQDVLPRQEATQGPVYYFLAAAATFWINSDDLPQRLEKNPHWLDTSPRVTINDNQNMVVHAPDERFPFSGTAQAVHIARLVSAVMGALAVWSTVRIAAMLFPREAWLPPIAGVLIAFNPQFIRTSATVSNDSTVVAIVALSVWLALKWSQPLPGRKASLALGIISGLAVLSKLNGIIAVVLVSAVVILRFWQTPVAARNFRNLLRAIGWIVSMSAMVSGWWFFRNYLLYGEWTATETHLNLAGRGYLSTREIILLLPEVIRTFWASFGWGQIRPPDWVYNFYNALLFAAIAGLAVVLWQIIRQRDWSRLQWVAFLGGWAAMIAALFARWISLVGSVSHARLMFTALPAVAILGGLGVGVWFPRPQWRRLVLTMLATALLSIAVGSLWQVVLPAYTPTVLRETDTALNTLPSLGWRYGDTIQLLTADTSPSVARPGDTVSVTLFWRAIATPAHNYSEFVRVVGKDERVIAGRNTFPGLGLLPTRYWRIGQVVQDVLPFRLPSDVTDVPQVADVRVGLFDFYSADRAGIPVVSQDGKPVLPVVARIKIVPTEWPTVSPQVPRSAQFADGIRLIGYDWVCANSCQLILYWQSDARPSAAYTVFIQYWVDERMQAGFDAPPRSGKYPTDWWDAGETIIDRHDLPLISGGELRVGLYRLDTGARLPILRADAQTFDNAYIIPMK